MKWKSLVWDFPLLHPLKLNPPYQGENKKNKKQKQNKTKQKNKTKQNKKTKTKTKTKKTNKHNNGTLG